MNRMIWFGTMIREASSLSNPPINWIYTPHLRIGLLQIAPSSLKQIVWAYQYLKKSSISLGKACKYALHINNNLYKRKVGISPICSIYKIKEETTNHFLLECDVVKRVWFSSHRSLRINLYVNDSFASWFMN